MAALAKTQPNEILKRNSATHAAALSPSAIQLIEETSGIAVSISPMEIWFRFPKFVLGYFVACVSYIVIAAAWPAKTAVLAAGTGVVAGPIRTLFFMLTFVAMGAMTDFSKLRGMGKLALLYAIALVVVIAPIAYGVAYLFHHGLMPPVVAQ